MRFQATQPSHSAQAAAGQAAELVGQLLEQGQLEGEAREAWQFKSLGGGAPGALSRNPYRLYCEYQFTPASGVTRFCTGLVPCF